MASKIWDSIEKFAGDIVTLEVVTLSGDITLAAPPPAAAAAATTNPVPPVTTANNTTNSGLGGIFQLVASRIDLNNATINVVAYTRCELDQDTMIFVRNGADPSLLAAHNATVLAAHTARYEALGVLAKAIGAKL